MPQGLDLALCSGRKASVAALSVQGTASVIQGVVGSWVRQPGMRAAVSR